MARVWPIAAEGGRNWLAIFTAGSELRRWDTDRATVDGLFSQAPIGLAVFDPHLCFIRINDALQKIHGIPREEALGRRITALFPGPEAEQMEERIRQVLETGEPVTKEHRAPTPTLQGWNRDWSITSFRLCDPAGKVLGVASAVVEVTERNRARDRLVLLNDASERIGTTLDVTRTAAELTEVAVPRLADFIAVDLLEGIALGEESVPGPVGGDAVLRRAAIRSVHEDAPEASYAPGALITFHAATPQAQAMATGEAVLLPTLEGTADWLTHDLHRAGKMTEAGVHSVMVVPLCARDVTLGVAHFYRWRRPDPFEADDLAAAGEVVARAAVCVDNARRFTHERHAALTLQQSLLHVTQAELSAVTTAHRYVPAGGPAGVGGDWFDIIPLSGARVGLIVGDVPGRGVHAVAEAGRLRTAVRALAQQDPAPDELLAQLDGIVSQSAAPEQTLGSPTAGIGGSCLYAVYDPVSRHCTLASAGHFPRCRSARTAPASSSTCPAAHRSASAGCPSRPPRSSSPKAASSLSTPTAFSPERVAVATSTPRCADCAGPSPAPMGDSTASAMPSSTPWCPTALPPTTPYCSLLAHTPSDPTGSPPGTSPSTPPSSPRPAP